MLLWGVVLLVLGIAAFLDSIYNYGEIFRRVNSFCFMLVSLGLLVRTSRMIRTAKRAESQKKREQKEKDRVEFPVRRKWE